MKHRYTAVSAVDLLFVVSCIALLLALSAPTSSRIRELSKRQVCSINLRGIGEASRVYTNANNEGWPIPPFRSVDLYDNPIDYLNDVQSADDWTPDGSTTLDEGAVGSFRQDMSTSNVANHPGAGSREVSTTRAFWMLVRNGAISTPQFICPSSPDTLDRTDDVSLYYDFTGYSHISYGYQVPFGPRLTQPRYGTDTRQIFAADKGPFYIHPGNVDWRAEGSSYPVAVDDPPSDWVRFNSPNHGGPSNGEGQNCLHSDGHVSFNRIPAVGIDNDNIYTVIDSTRWGVDAALIHGYSPHSDPVPYPGRDAFGYGRNRYSSTDTLIYP